MVRVNEPAISVGKKSEEQNMQAAKASLSELVDAIMYLSNQIDSLTARVNALESEE